MEEAAIKEPVLREFVQAGGSVRATVAGRNRGFALVFRMGAADKTLVTSRGLVRLFASLDTAGSFVQDRLGITRFEVDMNGYQPGLLRRPRPDRAEALRHTRTRMQQQLLEF